MFTTKIVQQGTVFHEYAIVNNQRVVHTLRADPKEAAAVAAVFNLVENCAQTTRQPFPFAIIHNFDNTASLCGPKDIDLKWGPVLVGPMGMLEKLLPDLIEAYNSTQSVQTKVKIK